MKQTTCKCAQQTESNQKLQYPNFIIYNKEENVMDPLTMKSVDTTYYKSAQKVAKYHCNCKYLWLRELHGLSAFMMANSLKEKLLWLFIMSICGAYSIYNTKNIMQEYGRQSTTTLITILPVKRLKFPTLVLCPRNPDFFKYYNVLKDLYNHVGYMENSTNFDILRYAMTGLGMDNANAEFFNKTYINKMDEIYLKWRGNRSQYDMLDFIYNKNGYTCSDMFQACYGGSQTYNCCDIFIPTYVMLRGRCFRLIDNYYQNDTDEMAKLSLFMNNMTSFLSNSGTVPQLVLYVTDSFYEVGIYPRYYLNSNDWNRIRFSQKVMKLVPNNARCSTESIYQGKSTCFVYKWLMQLLHQHNCTVPYYKYQFNYLTNVPICEARILVSNFHNISLTPATIGYKCTPACSRTENTVQLTSSIDYDPDPTYMFRLEASFTYLEYEQYKEVRKTSAPGFISELGGQTGLFVGSSIMTLVQLLSSIFIEVYRKIRKYLDKKGIRVRIGLYTIHSTEPNDRYYVRSLSPLSPFKNEPNRNRLPTIFEDNDADNIMNADVQLMNNKDDDDDLESVPLTVLSEQSEDERNESMDNEEKCLETPNTFTTNESVPHDTVDEEPENIKTAKLVWIKYVDDKI